MKYNIVVFLGSKGVGKDTAADLLRDQNSGFTKVSFAGALKDVVWELFSPKIKESRRIFGDIDQKEEPIPGWPIPDKLLQQHAFLSGHKDWTGRLLLQWFGTEVCRSVYQSIWVDLAIAKISLEPLSVVTDCRFQNEYDALCKLRTSGQANPLFVRIVRGADRKDGHASELLANSFPADVVIDNNGLITDLKSRIDNLYLEHICGT